MTAFVFLLFVGGMLTVHLLMPSRPFSESENRYLQQRPAFSLRGLTSGSFTAQYEKYLSDQFAFRDFWIGVESDAQRAVGKKENNGVYLGKNGYLMQKFNPPDDAVLEAKIDAIDAVAEAAPSVRTYVMLVPTAAGVLTDKLPAFASGGAELRVLNQVRQALHADIRFVDVYPTRVAMREDEIYYKTDHHWTTKGAFAAYTVLGRAMGFAPKDERDFTIQPVTDQFYGSLYSTSGFRHLTPDRIDLYLPKEGDRARVTYADGERESSGTLYAPNNLKKKDKYAVFLNGNHPFVKITTGSGSGKKLLVVKDSYANSLIPFLTSHFGEIDVVDPRYYDGSIEALIRERRFDSLLVLYNVITFCDEPSVEQIAE